MLSSGTAKCLAPLAGPGSTMVAAAQSATRKAEIPAAGVDIAAQPEGQHDLQETQSTPTALVKQPLYWAQYFLFSRIRKCGVDWHDGRSSIHLASLSLKH